MNQRLQQWQQTAELRARQLRQKLAPRLDQLRHSAGARVKQLQQAVQPRIQQVQRRLAPLGHQLQLSLQKPRNRLFASIAGVVVLAVVIVGVIAGNYVFGGGGNYQVNHGPISAPTLVATGSGTLLTIDQSSTTAR